MEPNLSSLARANSNGAIARVTKKNTISWKFLKNVPTFQNPYTFVTFLIGPSESKFVVHKEFACTYSPVLEAAFNSSFVEGQTQIYRIEDTTEGAFRFLVQWLYSQNIKLLVHGKGDKTDCRREDRMAPEKRKKHRELCELQDQSLIELWVLAEKFLIEPLQDLVVDLIENIRQTRKAVASPHCLQIAYEKTTMDSPLRRLLVDQYAWSMDMTSIRQLSSQLPHQMLADIVNMVLGTLAQKHRTTRERSRRIEEYHVIKASKLVACGICDEELMVEDEPYKIIPCQHSFGKECLRNHISECEELYDPGDWHCPTCYTIFDMAQVIPLNAVAEESEDDIPE